MVVALMHSKCLIYCLNGCSSNAWKVFGKVLLVVKSSYVSKYDYKQQYYVNANIVSLFILIYKSRYFSKYCYEQEYYVIAKIF